MKPITIILFSCATLLIACSGKDTATAKRIVELEDSLKVYRDSLSEYKGGGWTFNRLALVAKLSKQDLVLGDSLGVQLFLAAGNSDDSFFRTHPLIELGPRFDKVSIEKVGGVGWGFSILPTREGRDSISGMSLIPGHGGHKDTLKIPFAIYYNVKKRK